jgi:ATP-dependent DNA ligase
MHPKTEIRPERGAIKRVLDMGWVGQLKIHGHRAQIHIPCDASESVLVYNRQGQVHKKALPAKLDAELRRIFGPKDGWTVLDAVWLKGPDKLYVFDMLRREGHSLESATYAERWALLPRVYASDCIETLPLLRSVEKCLEALAAPGEELEGLVFKALNTPGFSDTSIVRCRKVPGG